MKKIIFSFLAICIFFFSIAQSKLWYDVPASTSGKSAWLRGNPDIRH